MGQKYTPEQKQLIEAIKAEDLRLLDSLVEAGLEVDTELKYGSTGLLIAAAKGNLATVRHLVAKGAKVNRRNLFGSSPLLEAVHKSHAEVARVLVESGAEINMQHKNGATALLTATFRRDLRLVKTLVTLGASAAVADYDGWDPVRWAIAEGNSALLEILASANGFQEAFERDKRSKEGVVQDQAEQAKEVGTVQSMRQRHVSREPATDAYWSAFMRAACSGDTRTVKELIEYGVEPNTPSPNGTTALIAAAKNGHQTVLTELLELGADLNHHDKEGMTALMWAASRGDAQMVLTLVKSGANPSEAVAVAGKEGHTEIVIALEKNP